MRRKKLGEYLKEERIKLNCTQDIIAKTSGLTRAIIISIEKGRSNYTIDSYLAFVNALRKLGSDINPVVSERFEENESGQAGSGKSLLNLSKQAFWDIDMGDIEGKEDEYSDWIISRIAQHGSFEDMIETESFYGREKIVSVLNRMSEIEKSKSGLQMFLVGDE